MLCWLGGGGAGIFLGQDFLKFSWNDLIPVLQSDKTSGVVETFLNKNYLEC